MSKTWLISYLLAVSKVERREGSSVRRWRVSGRAGCWLGEVLDSQKFDFCGAGDERKLW